MPSILILTSPSKDMNTRQRTFFSPKSLKLLIRFKQDQLEQINRQLVNLLHYSVFLISSFAQCLDDLHEPILVYDFAESLASQFLFLVTEFSL